MKKNFCIPGGDLRQLQVARKLTEQGYGVSLFGFSDYASDFHNVRLCDTLQEAFADADYVILPLPCSTDGVHLNAPYRKNPVSLKELYSYITPQMTVFAGKFSSPALSERGVTIKDYFLREELQVLNAIPTAEGALQVAMQECPFTLHSSRCLIVGYGRIGKVLARMLNNLDANVCVAARKRADLAWIRAAGCLPISIQEIGERIAGFDIVFNTVPAMVIGKEEFKKARKDTLFIDLASKPGGIDFEEAKICGINAIWLLSLPGKVAPLTAGEIIAETILNIIENQAAGTAEESERTNP